MYQKLRDEFPEFGARIRTLPKMVKDRYPVIVSFTHPLVNEIVNVLRGYTTTSTIKSQQPLDGSVSDRRGHGYAYEPARLLYRRMRKLKPEFRAEWNHINIYMENLDQARDWIQWARTTQQQYKIAPHDESPTWIHYIKAVETDTQVGEITRKQERFRDYQYYVKFQDHHFANGEQQKQFRTVLKNASEDLLMNSRLSAFVEGKNSGYWGVPQGLWNCDLYAKDESALVILQLAYGYTIKKIYRVKYLGK
jgi:hypothetical protein